MASTKFETIGADEAVVGDKIHFTASGTAFLVTANDGKAIDATQTGNGSRVHVPYTGFTMVVRETAK